MVFYLNLFVSFALSGAAKQRQAAFLVILYVLEPLLNRAFSYVVECIIFFDLPFVLSSNFYIEFHKAPACYYAGSVLITQGIDCLIKFLPFFPV